MSWKSAIIVQLNFIHSDGKMHSWWCHVLRRGRLDWAYLFRALTLAPADIKALITWVSYFQEQQCHWVCFHLYKKAERPRYTNFTSICPLRHAQWRGVFFSKLVALTFWVSVMQSQTELMSQVWKTKCNFKGFIRLCLWLIRMVSVTELFSIQARIVDASFS
jgi:hypothetical protein